MATERRILIYFDELVTSLVRTYKMTMNTHIYSPNDIISSMQGITPVDAVEVVHGRWIEEIEKNEAFESEMVKCSECGQLRFFESNYCPNCGADMRGDWNA